MNHSRNSWVRLYCHKPVTDVWCNQQNSFGLLNNPYCKFISVVSILTPLIWWKGYAWVAVNRICPCLAGVSFTNTISLAYHTYVPFSRSKRREYRKTGHPSNIQYSNLTMGKNKEITERSKSSQWPLPQIWTVRENTLAKWTPEQQTHMTNQLTMPFNHLMNLMLNCSAIDISINETAELLGNVITFLLAHTRPLLVTYLGVGHGLEITSHSNHIQNLKSVWRNCRWR